MRGPPRTINAIPTQYGGINFRSRLEAKWACFFDALGWTWDYEPLDLAGYIPDFLITVLGPSPYASGHDLPPQQMLVECKPFGTLSEIQREWQTKIEQTWNGSALLVGNAPILVPDGMILGSGLWSETWKKAHLLYHSKFGWVPLPEKAGARGLTHLFEARMAWNEACNKTQWKPVK